MKTIILHVITVYVRHVLKCYYVLQDLCKSIIVNFM